MSAWRRKALELLPEFRGEIEDPTEGLHLLFHVALLPALREAHRQGNDELLDRIYSFAEWTARQRAFSLWNAAGVSFYEHLFDDLKIRDQVAQRLSPELIRKHWELWPRQLGSNWPLIEPLLKKRLDA